MMYVMRVFLWELRVRHLGRTLRRRGLPMYEVTSALREHAQRHPHPTG